MTQLAHALADLVAAIDREIAVSDNPYLRSLRDGTLSRDQFVATQVQFCFAVDFFPRPMAAAAARIPTSAGRVDIVRNVWEEHGEGERARMHGATFREFLHRLIGLPHDHVDRQRLWPEVRAFNTVLAGAATLDDHRVSIAAFGMIEHMFQSISGWIGAAVAERGWLPADRIVHYDVHEVLDVRHSEDFFAIVRPDWERGETYEIEQGLRLGAYAFDQLYRGLFAARDRRWDALASDPHAR